MPSVAMKSIDASAYRMFLHLAIEQRYSLLDELLVVDV